MVGVRRSTTDASSVVRSLDGDEAINCWRWHGDLVGVNWLRRDSVSSSGDRLVGVISTSISDLAGLTVSGGVPLKGEAKGFRLFPGVVAAAIADDFVGVLKGVLDDVPFTASALTDDPRFEGVLNTSCLSPSVSLCFELEAVLERPDDTGLHFAFASPPTACHVSYVPAIAASARMSRLVGSRPCCALNAFCHVLSSRRRSCSIFTSYTPDKGGCCAIPALSDWHCDDGIKMM